MADDQDLDNQNQAPDADTDAEGEGERKARPMYEERASRLDELAERAVAAMDAELRAEGLEGVPKDDSPPADPPAQDDGNSAALDLGRSQPPQAGAASLDPNATVELVIDGQRVQRTVADLIRDAQKQGAADRRLAEATALLRQAQATVQPPPQPKETPATVQPSATQSPPAQAVKDRVKAAVGALMNGDEDAAAERLAEVLAGAVQAQPAPQAPDTDALAEAVTRKLEEGSALQTFFGEYQRIATNPYLQNAADAALVKVQTENPDLPYVEQLRKAGDAVYAYFGYEREQPPAPPQDTAPATTPRSTSLAARKARMDVPPARSGSAASSRQETPNSSEGIRSQIVAEMAARRRGLARGAP